jgi:xylulokinase
VKFLGLDVGTGGSRAVVIDSNGTLIASSTIEHQPFASPQIGWAEQSPEDWWQASCKAIQAILQNVSAEEIAAVSFSGQMHGSVLLDVNDEVMRPALLWCDQRTSSQVETINQIFEREHLIELVSNPAVTGFTLPKLLWVRDNEPEIWSRVHSVLLPKDYIRFRLSGDKASDVADSSGTLYFDVRNRNWSYEILDTLGIDRSILPKVYESIEQTGVVSEEGANATGLRPGTPVIAGAGDNAAGAIGAGIVSPGTVGATIGTSGVVFVVTDQPKLDLKGRTHSLCHAIPNRWHMTGVTLAAGFSLKWFRDVFANGATYDELTREAESIMPGADGVIWLPYLMGERTPHMDANARAALIGLTSSHGRGHITRAIMEGVAFSLREAMDIFRELGATIDEIRLGGGAATSVLWRHIQADVYGQRVAIIKADEGAAFGAAILAAVGVGAWDSVDAACAEAIQVKEYVEPSPTNTEALERNYKIYKSLYSALETTRKN